MLCASGRKIEVILKDDFPKSVFFVFFFKYSKGIKTTLQGGAKELLYVTGSQVIIFTRGLISICHKMAKEMFNIKVISVLQDI